MTDDGVIDDCARTLAVILALTAELQALYALPWRAREQVERLRDLHGANGPLARAWDARRLALARVEAVQTERVIVAVAPVDPVAIRAAYAAGERDIDALARKHGLTRTSTRRILWGHGRKRKAG